MLSVWHTQLMIAIAMTNTFVIETESHTIKRLNKSLTVERLASLPVIYIDPKIYDRT